ncbi:hypothetical protein HQ50_02030 [Porphyromonas sp. COT-052 OH4946]|uniref:hypothetical protein n=1 Tax=Porphyromonas sp. COT-052 OH4946 TaxID=1515618 RepID=UPI00051D8476|nr:hypothetical protein [Porphyromonas sp. COT-052 OH4946]KGL56396.1 hypothetical protein HQ50_02030 [Porphyromonas sp. COT-052 OH4946]
MVFSYVKLTLFTVFEQSAAFTVFAVFALFRTEQIADGIGSLVNALHLGATLVIGSEEIIPPIVVEKKKTVSR